MKAVQRPVSIIVIGDSIAHGLGTLYGGWVSALQGFLSPLSFGDTSSRHFVLNLSFPGETVRGASVRIPEEVGRRFPHRTKGQTLIGVIALGLNDAQVCIPEMKPRFSLEEFEKNFQTLLVTAQEHFDHVIVLGLSPVNEEKTMPIVWAHELGYTNCRIEKFESVISAITQSSILPFIPLFKILSKLDRRTLLPDGVHMVEEGHKLIYHSIMKQPAFRDFLQLPNSSGVDWFGTYLEEIGSSFFSPPKRVARKFGNSTDPSSC